MCVFSLAHAMEPPMERKENLIYPILATCAFRVGMIGAALVGRATYLPVLLLSVQVDQEQRYFCVPMSARK
jgi:hypothetical protein